MVAYGGHWTALLAWSCILLTYAQEVQLRGSQPRQLASKKKIDEFAFPDIFMIGAMKAGTTSLTDLMRGNSHICEFGEKEKHFFSGGDYDTKYNSEADRYRAEFSGCKLGQLTMDATPGYTADVRTTERIQETYSASALKKKKFIYILREPISRHYSEYQMNVRLCIDADGDLKRGNFMTWRVYRHERSCEAVMDDFDGKTNDPANPEHKDAKVTSFHDWCLSEKGRMELRRGLYKEVIILYLSIIGREQLFFINFDTLVKNTSIVMNGLNRFLNMPNNARWDNSVVLPMPKKATKRPALPTYMDCTTVAMLDMFFKKIEGDFFGWMNNLTSIAGKAPGEPTFLRYSSNPFEKCVHKHNWTGPWSEANYWNTSDTSFKKETWTFVEDSLKVLKKHGSYDGRI